MSSVGETLRRERVAQGLDLAEVAARTKINYKYLTALEADDRKSLPGSFFYKSFVHQYARSLSLDTGQIDAEVDHVLCGEAPLPLPRQELIQVKTPPPISKSSGFPRRALLWSTTVPLMAILGCSGYYAWWHKPRQVFSISAATDAQVVVNVIAKEPTWISVSSDGKPVFTGVLQANESRSVEGKQVAKITVGNAAGLEVRLNGKAIGELGPRGQLRVVVFTREKFEVLQPLKDGA